MVGWFFFFFLTLNFAQPFFESLCSHNYSVGSILHFCSYFFPGSSPKKFPSHVSILSTELPVQVAEARGERGCVQGHGVSVGWSCPVGAEEGWWYEVL